MEKNIFIYLSIIIYVINNIYNFLFVINSYLIHTICIRLKQIYVVLFFYQINIVQINSIV